MKNIQEMLQARAALVDKQNAIVNAALTASRAMTAEEQTEFKNLDSQIKDWDATIEAAEQAQARKNELDQTYQNRQRAIDPGNRQETVLDDGGFHNIGEMANAIRNHYAGRGNDSRIQNLSTGDAGILIPPRFSQDLLALEGEGEIVAPRATGIPAGDPPDADFTIPYFSQGANGALGGITLHWTGEAKQVEDVGTPGIKDLTLKSQEVSGLCTINNKTLDNWAAAGAFMQNLMRQALASGRDYKFLFGTGAGAPLGVFKSPGAIKIDRQTSGTITYLDTLKMLARLYAGPGQAVYVANQTIMPTIMTLKGDDDKYIFNGGDATKGIPPTLNGLPILWNGKTPLLGSEGDLMLAKFNYYLIKSGAGPFLDISKDFKFDTVQTVFRIVARMDGQLWVKDPLKLEDGATTVSPVIILK